VLIVVKGFAFNSVFSVANASEFFTLSALWRERAGERWARKTGRR